MTTKAATPNGLSRQETNWLVVVDNYLAEMGIIRKRMKVDDERIRAAGQRIRRADAAISRSQAETRAVLRHAQASR